MTCLEQFFLRWRNVVDQEGTSNAEYAASGLDLISVELPSEAWAEALRGNHLDPKASS